MAIESSNQKVLIGLCLEIIINSKAVNIFNSHFSLTESVYLRIHKIVKVEQHPGEDI